jgi:Ca2+-binding EF-hand superfamily protein
MDALKNEKLKTLFNKFDKNQTGYIERDELKQLLIALGESPSSIRIEKLVIFINIYNYNKFNLI